jgi:hypothetical protein
MNRMKLASQNFAHFPLRLIERAGGVEQMHFPAGTPELGKLALKDLQAGKTAIPVKVVEHDIHLG